jgi:hypothetical protein
VSEIPSKPDLFAACISQDEVGDYSVTETGWYALDDGEKVVLGPFASLAECEAAIHDRERMTSPAVARYCGGRGVAAT